MRPPLPWQSHVRDRLGYGAATLLRSMLRLLPESRPHASEASDVSLWMAKLYLHTWEPESEGRFVCEYEGDRGKAAISAGDVQPEVLRYLREDPYFSSQLKLRWSATGTVPGASSKEQARIGTEVADPFGLLPNEKKMLSCRCGADAAL